MRWPIRLQLSVPLFMLLAGVAGISFWTAIAAADRAWRQIEDQVRHVTHTLSDSDFPLTERVLEQMQGLSRADFLLVRNDGHRIGTLESQEAALPAVNLEATDWHTLRLGPRFSIGRDTFFCSGLRLGPSRVPGGGTLYILYPEQLWRDSLWQAIRPSLILGTLGTLVALALAFWIARGIVRRIDSLQRRTRLIAAGNFNSLPEDGWNDELRDLGLSVNVMARRLEHLQQTLQQTERLRLLGQIGAGLAHQLRNGVTGARLAVQLHLKECKGAADPATLNVALRQLTLLEVNLKRFLDLGGAEKGHREPCLLGSLVQEVITLSDPHCQHSGIDLHWKIPLESFRVMGDPAQLTQLFINVIQNAIEAAGPGGSVEVAIRTSTVDDNAHMSNQKLDGTLPKAICVIDVTDSGPGPTLAVADRLFEPFVTGKPQGIGLGLPVARQVAESHGGTILWFRRDNRTCFQISLPLLSVEAASYAQ